MSGSARSRMPLRLLLSSIAGWRTTTPCIPIPGWAIAHPGSTSFPNPLRVRFDGVNSKHGVREFGARRNFVADEQMVRNHREALGGEQVRAFEDDVAIDDFADPGQFSFSLLHARIVAFRSALRGGSGDKVPYARASALSFVRG